MNRRGFLKLTAGGIAAAIAAPYVITTPGLLMKVRATALWHPTQGSVRWATLDNMTATEVLARQAEGIRRLGEHVADLERAFLFGRGIGKSMLVYEHLNLLLAK